MKALAFKKTNDSDLYEGLNVLVPICGNLVKATIERISANSIKEYFVAGGSYLASEIILIDPQND